MTEASEISFGLEVTKGFAAKFLMAVLGFVGTILFARVLGPVAFGGFYLVWSVVQIAKLPVDGFSQASKKRYSETQTNRHGIIGATLLVIFGFSLVSLIAAVLFRSQLSSFSGLENAYLLFVILYLSISVFTPFQGMLAGTGRVSLTTWIDSLRSVLTTPLQLAFVLLGYGAAGMAYGLSLATILTIPVTQHFLGITPSWPSRHLLRQLWVFARYSTVSVTLGRVYNRFDIVLLGLLLTPSAAGQYEVAFKLTVPAVMVSKVAGDGLMARVSNLRSKNLSVGADVSNTLSFVSILSIPIFFGAAVLSRPLVVTVYGSDYAAAAPLLIGLALYRVFDTQASSLTQTLNGLDFPEVNARISAATLLINIILGVLLTLRIGALGVVIATVIAEGLKYAIAAYAVKREVPNVDLLPRTLLEQVSVAAGMSILVLLLHQLVPVRSWLHLLALVGFGVVVYGIGLLAVSQKLRFTITSILRDAGLIRWIYVEK